MTNQTATPTIARQALSAAMYNAARIAAADIAKLDATYGALAQRKVDAVSADSTVETLIKVAEDLVLIADRIDREVEAPEPVQPKDCTPCTIYRARAASKSPVTELLEAVKRDVIGVSEASAAAWKMTVLAGDVDYYYVSRIQPLCGPVAGYIQTPTGEILPDFSASLPTTS